MKKSNFEEKVSTSFKSLTPDILDKIKSSNEFHVPKKERKYDFSRLFNRRFTYSLTSVFILAIVLFSILSSGTKLDPVVASTVTLDINPSIEITLDSSDNVINITAINTDGDLLIDRNIKFRGLSLDRTIEIIIAKAISRGFIIDSVDGNTILIDVSSNNFDNRTRIEESLESIITQEMRRANKPLNIRRENRDELSKDENIDLETNSRHYKISLAKLHLINRIIDIDSSYKIIDLKDFSIRVLYNILDDLDTNDNNSNDHRNHSGSK